MNRRLRLSLALGSALAFALGAAPLLAAPEDVYVLSEGNILKVDFDAASTQVLNGDVRHRLQGIVVLDDGLDGVHLVVGENPEDKLWFYDTTPLGGAIGQEITSASGLVSLPEGINAGPDSDVYVVNQKGSSSKRDVWRVHRDCPGCAGGYDTLELVDGDLPATTLEDTLVVNFVPASGPLAPDDLLVLSRQPPKVWRYPGGSGPRQLFIGAGGTGFPAGTTRPTAFAFAPDGNLLVATTAGVVLRFDPLGQRVLPDFASGIGDGSSVLKMRVGIQDREDRAFITDHDGNKVHRFKIEAAGTGTLLDTVKVHRPLGVGIRTSRAAPTVAGEDRDVRRLKGYQLKIEDVEHTGLTDARLFLFTDPHPGSFRFLSNVPGLIEASGLPDREIPAYIRAFVRFGEGPQTFFLVVVDSTATFAKTVEHDFTPNDYGFETACSNGENPSPQQPRTFRATDAFEGAVIEGDLFVDVSSLCGTNGGRDSRASAFLTGYDTRDLEDVVAFKLEMLSAAINTEDVGIGGLGSFISGDMKGTLNDLLDETVLDYGEGRIDEALADLDAFIAAIQGNPEEFDNSERNVSGELEARAVSAQYIVCGAVAPDCNRPLP